MFAVTMRFAAGLAIGAAAALWLTSRRNGRQAGAGDHVTITDPRVPERPAPERFSHYPPDVDGRVESNALVDGAIEDTFPASDPPAFMQSVVVGPPPQHEKSDASSAERKESAMASSRAGTP